VFRCAVIVEVEADTPGSICEGEAIAECVNEDGRTAFILTIGCPNAGEAGVFASTTAGRAA
jgi:hypothetical protein